MLEKIRQGRLSNLFTGTGKHCRGITLIELLIVIALIAVFTYLGMPSFKAFLQYSNLSRDAWIMLSDLRYYREEAIVKHYDYAFTFNTAANSYTVEQRTAPADTPVKEVKTQTLDSDITQAANTVFTPSGEATTASTIVIHGENPGDAFQITISPTTGMVKMEQL